MRNYWLDRIRRREEEKMKEEQKKGKFLYPPAIWKLVSKKLKKRPNQAP